MKTIMLLICFSFISMGPYFSEGAYGADSNLSNSDIDKLTTYAVILGRAIGCGISTGYESKKVGRWLDSKCPPGSSNQKRYLPIFINGVKYHAQQQSSGKSPDTCSQVRKTFNNMYWP